ncbi:MAG: TolC family protein [Bryobacteraceae bacterium]
MFRICRAIALFGSMALLRAEVYTMTMKQAVGRAQQQNPEIAMAKLDEAKAREAIRIQKDPFTPRIYVGSGLAYSNGFPMSIDGSAPSVLQARASQFIFNRQQSYVLAQTKEEARGAVIATTAKKDDVAFRTASLYLDAERAARAVEMAQKEVESIEKVLATVQSRVQEGRDLPIEAKRAEFNLARAKQVADSLKADQESNETSLAIVLGYTADDRVRPAGEQRTSPQTPSSEAAAIEGALQASTELRHLESQIVAKGLESRAARAARLPRIDLVAQYGLFATFNHYQDYFVKYQRNNGEIGMSFQLPLLPGPGVSATAAQSDADAAKLRLQFSSTRNRITADVRQSFRDIRKAEELRDVARLDLEVAREQLTVDLAMMQEGRLLLRQVEEARIAENDRWVAFYDAQYSLERAQWNLARQMGDLMAMLK